MENPEWLHPLVLFDDFDGHWPSYEEAIYRYFRQDFVDSYPLFQGREVRLKRGPLVKGKELTFWHLVSEGGMEEDRLPDLRRCERIRWPRPIIEHVQDTAVKLWRNCRRQEVRICLWLEDWEYLVILAVRRSSVILWTAYPVFEDHRKRKLRKEYDEYIKADAAH